MLTYGATDIAQIINKRKHTTLGYYIFSKYDDMIKPILEKIDRQKNLVRFHKLKSHQE